MTVDVWTLRCLFNRGRFWERANAGEFVEELQRSHPASAKYNLGPGGISREVYYRDPASRFPVFRVHRLESAGGIIGASGRPDPKQLYVAEHGIDYHQHPGNRWWESLRRDPSDFLRDSRHPLVVGVKKVYGAW